MRPNSCITDDDGPQADRILTKKQSAAYIQTTQRYLERQIRAGLLKALKPTGKLVRIRRSDLDAFLESGATK
jgi:excisionase family DNA binding protein